MGFASPNKYAGEFPVRENLIYLNHAAVAPLPRRAADAIRRFADDALLWGSLHYADWLATYEGIRNSAAQLINATPREIALVKNTSEGIATIAMGLNWKPGDRMVGFREEFPANYYPWKRLEAKGLEVTWLSIHDSLDRIEQATRGAKLLAVSFVNFLSGFRVDLKAIGEICRRNDCFYFVDAIQGLGVLPVDVEDCNIDALASDGHKWLLGAEGCGILYVRQSWQDRIEPVEFGWTNVASFADYGSRDMTLRQDAGRYECGTLNTPGCFCLNASLELILEVGVATIGSAVLARADRIADGVQAKGYELATERTAANSSGIVSFRKSGVDARALVETLGQHKIVAAPRAGWLRTSPHFYIEPEDIDRMLDVLP